MSRDDVAFGIQIEQILSHLLDGLLDVRFRGAPFTAPQPAQGRWSPVGADVASDAVSLVDGHEYLRLIGVLDAQVLPLDTI